MNLLLTPGINIHSLGKAGNNKTKMATSKQISSSHFQINLLCIKEMKNQNTDEEPTLVQEVEQQQNLIETEKREIWTVVMKTILATFEQHPKDAPRVVADVEDILHKEFEEEGGMNVDIRVRILSKQDHRQDRNKVVLVQLNDPRGTVLVFRVLKKKNLLSLRAITAAKVSQCIQANVNRENIEDIDNVEVLEVPRHVIPDIRKALIDDWKVTTYSRYLYVQTCCVGCAALKLANHW